MKTYATIDEVKKDFFKVLKKTPPRYSLPVLTDEEKEKLLILNSMYYQNHKYIETIKKLIKNRSAFQIAALVRIMFENAVTMALVYCYSRENGINRFKSFADYEEYQYINEYDRFRSGLSKQLFIPQVIQNAKVKHDEFIKQYGKNHQNWTGKSIKENCLILDRDFITFFKIQDLFTIQYIQLYKFLSRTIHGNPNSLINVRSKRYSVFKRGYVYTTDGLDNLVLYISYATLSWLLTLKVFSMILKDHKLENYVDSELNQHSHIMVNNLETRDYILKIMGIKKKKI